MHRRKKTVSTTTSPVVVWFRLDLRISDNPALDAASRSGHPVLPVFIWQPDEPSPWTPGAASRWWLHQSLERLSEELADLGCPLVIRRGDPLEQLMHIVQETGAKGVFWNRVYEPFAIARDSRVKERLKEAGLAAESWNSSVLHEPWTVLNQSNQPFQVFTAFWRNCLRRPEPSRPLPKPKQIPHLTESPSSLELDELQLEPRLDWAYGLRREWHPGSQGALAELQRFLNSGLADYDENRDRPDLVGTSRLSPHLHFGEISPREIWHATKAALADSPQAEFDWQEHRFITELGWREFGRHLLFHFPHTSEEPLREAFERFPWRKSPDLLRVWQRGRTGVPFVDAGMRELWATGWMHNRVRLITASFLVKNLLISWQDGARWFWDTLVDADLASNTLGWQWTAGCGADAAPYFRIFNPVTQGEKFDPSGTYVRRWVPELSRLPNVWIHKPFQAPPEVLEQAGILLGRDYPEPVVSLFASRQTALDAHRALQAQT